MQLTLCLTLKVSHGLFTDTVTPKTRLQMANPSLESVKPSAVWHSHSFLLSPSIPSCLGALSTKSKHWQLQYFNSFLKTDFSPLCLMLICFLCGRDQDYNVIRVQVKTKAPFGSDKLDEGWKEQRWICAAFSTFLFLALLRWWMSSSLLSNRWQRY